MLKIAIQGISGCFHREAASSMYGDDIEILECTTFQAVFDAVKSGVVDRGVVAIENSIQGSINPVYRLLQRERAYITDEIYIDIDQYLIGLTAEMPIDSESIQVFSMSPAFAQTELWLEKHLPLASKIEYFDTAASVKHIVDLGDVRNYAVAGKVAARQYGAQTIGDPINDDPHNTTRFFGISKTSDYGDESGKTSIILTTDNTAGSLYRALGVFERNGVSLSKLSSYPIPGDDWHYMFYIDYLCGLYTGESSKVLDELVALGCEVKVLGTYKYKK